MKLNYFELLSPEPVYLPDVGGIVSPKLKDISSIGIRTYQYYLTILLMDAKSFFTTIDREEQFEALSAEEQAGKNIFDLLIASEQSAVLLQTVLNFFIEQNVLYSAQHGAFLIQKDDTVIGMISEENYPLVCDLIFQRNYIKSHPEEDLSKVKSQKALQIMKKLRKGREEKAQQAKSDRNMELGNVISAVANKSQSLNMINIWDLTVYQLWDCFFRLSNNSIYEIQSMSIAAWGNKDKSFDATAWFKRLDTTE